MAALPAVVALLSWLAARASGSAFASPPGSPARSRASPWSRFARDADGELASGSLAGIALLVGAVTCEALYVVIGKKLSASMGPKRISALINLWGLALVAPFALWQLRGFSPSFIPESSWWLLLAYSIAASVVTVWLWMTGLKHVPASSAGIFTVFLPVSAAAVGVFFYGEEFTTAQAAAFALALAGVVLATWPCAALRVGRGGAAERLTRQPRHRRRRLALQPRIRPDLAPAARPGLAVAQDPACGATRATTARRARPGASM